MRVLIVEDSEETIEDFFEELEPLGIDLRVAKSKSSAEAQISDDYQVAVCDLKIPLTDDAIDSDVEHGRSILARLRVDSPGIPVLGFSAHGTSPDLIGQLLELGEQIDFLGEGEEQPILTFFNKSELLECLAAVRRIKDGWDRLMEIEIATGPNVLELSPPQALAIRILARRRGARVARIAQLGGGLSGVMVLRIRLEGPNGERIASGVAKIGPLDPIKDEYRRYKTLVAGTLELGVCPGIADTVFGGSGRVGGLLYELAEEYPTTLMEVMGTPEAVLIVDRLRSRTAKWRIGVPTAATRIADIRRPIVDDATLGNIAADSLDWSRIQRIEQLLVQSRICTQHGDLHGLNVLVSNSNEPLLIDFGEAATLSAATDPVTLEFSPLFHPSSPIEPGVWPSLEQARRWYDLSQYIDGSPIAEYVQECREWAHDEDTSAGDKEVVAAVYIYAIRQLKYADSNHDLAMALIEGCLDRLGRS